MKPLQILLGFIVGLLISVGGFLLSIYASSAEPLLSPDTVAYQDRSACPGADASDLIGAWRGENLAPRVGPKYSWVTTRSRDGTYDIVFKYEAKDGAAISTERGYWSYFRCIYSVIVLDIDGEATLAQEVYRVHEINDDFMRYTNYRSGNSFEMQRVNR